MSFWRKNVQEYEEMVEAIKQEPGMNPGELADKLGVHPSTVTRRLPGMNDSGILLSEDERGGLHLFPEDK